MENLREMTNEELAVSYAKGNRSAFDILLERNQPQLFSYILFVVRDKEKANDVFQETLMKAIVKLLEGKYQPSGKFSAWLMRIAHNVIIDTYRANRSEHIVENGADNDLSNLAGDAQMELNAEARAVNAQIMNDVRNIMDALPPVQREVVFMRYYQDLSFKEIAEMTGVSINTALGRMRYAIINMRRMTRENKIMLSLLD